MISFLPLKCQNKLSLTSKETVNRCRICHLISEYVLG